MRNLQILPHFSRKERIQLEEIGCAVLNDEALTIQENNKINRVNELNSVKEVSLDRSFDDKGDTARKDQVCVSEISIASDREFQRGKQGLPTLQQDEFFNSRVPVRGLEFGRQLKIRSQ